MAKIRNKDNKDNKILVRVNGEIKELDASKLMPLFKAIDDLHTMATQLYEQIPSVGLALLEDEMKNEVKHTHDNVLPSNNDERVKKQEISPNDSINKPKKGGML